MVNLTEPKKLVDEEIDTLLSNKITKEKIISDIKKTIVSVMKNKGISAETCIHTASELIILSTLA